MTLTNPKDWPEDNEENNDGNNSASIHRVGGISDSGLLAVRTSDTLGTLSKSVHIDRTRHGRGRSRDCGGVRGRDFDGFGGCLHRLRIHDLRLLGL